MTSQSSISEIAAAAQGDPAAFGIIYHRYIERIYRYVFHQVNNIEDAEDLSSQVFVSAWESLPKYEERGLFTAWIFGIARNKVRAFHRKQRVDLPLDQTHTQSADNPDPFTLIETDEALIALKEIITGLHPEQQELLSLRFGGGMTYRQIGAVLGKSESAVKMQMNRLLDRLQAEWEDRT
jgi:RNA polymerase sigma-70 factor (ECF subfamily)